MPSDRWHVSVTGHFHMLSQFSLCSWGSLWERPGCMAMDSVRDWSCFTCLLLTNAVDCVWDWSCLQLTIMTHLVLPNTAKWPVTCLRHRSFPHVVSIFPLDLRRCCTLRRHTQLTNPTLLCYVHLRREECPASARNAPHMIPNATNPMACLRLCFDKHIGLITLTWDSTSFAINNAKWPVTCLRHRSFSHVVSIFPLQLRRSLRAPWLHQERARATGES